MLFLVFMPALKNFNDRLDVVGHWTNMADSWTRPLFFRDEDSTMNNPVSFDRLVGCVEKIARHSYYPGIDEAIELCLEDVDDLWGSGEITEEQREALRFVLLGITMAPQATVTAA
jgi:hypothetical protein